MIDIFLLENKLVRLVLQHQKLHFSNTQGIFSGVVSDYNPLAIETNTQKSRGQFHKMPTYDENRFFRIRKATRQINAFELTGTSNDHETLISMDLNGMED